MVNATDFVCIEVSAMTHGPDDEQYWANTPSRQSIVRLSGASSEEVRQKLNAYLASSDAHNHYGAQKDGKNLGPMPVGQTKIGPYITKRNNSWWEWNFEIVPFEESLKPQIHISHIPVWAHAESYG